jgi:hypothetical protein
MTRKIEVFCPEGAENFLIGTLSRQILGSTPPTLQWIPRFLSPEVKRSDAQFVVVMTVVAVVVMLPVGAVLIVAGEGRDKVIGYWYYGIRMYIAACVIKAIHSALF